MFSFIARAKRSLAGKNVSRSITPTFWNGGDCTAWIRPAMSRSCPARQAWSRTFASRMCSRLEIGSASMPRSASRPETGRGDSLAIGFGLVDQGRRRSVERAEHRQRQPGAASRRIDRQVDRVAEPCDPCAVLVPRRPALLAICSAVCAANCSTVRALAGSPRPDRPTERNPPAAARGRSAAGCPGLPWDRSRSPGCRRSPPLPAAPGPDPVLPLPVMPTQTACVVRSFDS